MRHGDYDEIRLTERSRVWTRHSRRWSRCLPIASRRKRQASPNKAGHQQDRGHRLRNDKIALPEPRYSALGVRAATEGVIRAYQTSRQTERRRISDIAVERIQSNADSVEVAVALGPREIEIADLISSAALARTSEGRC